MKKGNRFSFLALTVSLINSSCTMVLAGNDSSAPGRTQPTQSTQSITPLAASAPAPTQAAQTQSPSLLTPTQAVSTTSTSTTPQSSTSATSSSTSSNIAQSEQQSKEESQSVTDALANDAMLSAFKDELIRTQTRLTLGGHPPPYFTSYTAHEQEHFNLYASFGALDRCDESHQRWLTIDVRAGDRKFDSENSGGLGFAREATNTSLDDNYDALRHELWLRTDRSYKRAIEGLESKKATLQQKKIIDLPEAMAAAPVVISIGPKPKLLIDREKWKKDIREISGVFKNYPAVVNSEVSMVSRCQIRWFTNSEGSTNREGEQGAVVGMTASGQAKDGMDVQDFEIVGSNNPALLPDPSSLNILARRLAERVTALSNAPVIEDYRGPILFEKQAAAEFFAQTLTPSLVNPNERVSHLSSYNSTGGLKEKLGRRILPTSMTVVDDPLARDFHGVPLKGGYLVDDEGVKAEKVVLVQNGILRTLCSGRTPSRYVKESNGHWHVGGAGPSVLLISAKDSKPVPELKSQLMQMGKEDGLKYVLIARRITTLYLRFFNAGEPGFKSLRNGFRGDQISLAPPTLLYKVNVDDGSEELVRGAKFEHLSSRTWRDIVGTGDDSQPYLVLTAGLPSNTTSTSLVTPSILISEMDVTRAQQEADKPMLLKNPYFDRTSFSALPPR